MKTSSFNRWNVLLVMISMLCSFLPNVSIAADADGQLLLRPHCELQDQEQCPQYLVEDPHTLQTPPLHTGDTLDMDLVYINTSGTPIQHVRAWVAYDSGVLDGNTVTVSPSFPVTTPGEADVSAQDGYIKIQAMNTTQPVSGFVVPIARITLHVKSVPGGGSTVLSLFDVKSGTDGHTYVTTGNAATEQNLLAPQQSSLHVYLQTTGATATTSSNASEASTQASSAPATIQQPDTAPVQSSFTLLQVQHVTVTTEGSAIYVAWDPLRSSELQGYNVYYGTKSGEYLQRKSVGTDITSLALRGLPLDTVYYLAVRGVNQSNQESAFSQEVGVKVGSPATSTSPMLGKIPGSTGKNPLTGKTIGTSGVPGQSGLPSLFVLLLIASAGIGTLFAFRRQLSSSAH